MLDAADLPLFTGPSWHEVFSMSFTKATILSFKKIKFKNKLGKYQVRAHWCAFEDGWYLPYLHTGRQTKQGFPVMLKCGPNIKKKLYESYLSRQHWT